MPLTLFLLASLLFCRCAISKTANGNEKSHPLTFRLTVLAWPNSDQSFLNEAGITMTDQKFGQFNGIAQQLFLTVQITDEKQIQQLYCELTRHGFAIREIRRTNPLK